MSSVFLLLPSSSSSSFLPAQRVQAIQAPHVRQTTPIVATPHKHAPFHHDRRVAVPGRGALGVEPTVVPVVLVVLVGGELGPPVLGLAGAQCQLQFPTHESPLFSVLRAVQHVQRPVPRGLKYQCNRYNEAKSVIDTHRQTSTPHRHTSTHVDTHRQTSTDIDTTSTNIDKHRQTSTNIDTHRHTSTNIDTHRQTSTSILQKNKKTKKQKKQKIKLPASRCTGPNGPVGEWKCL
jgi:hypothetical protein